MSTNARKMAIATWDRFAAAAPKTMGEFNEVQKEYILDFMALTYLDGYRDGATEIRDVYREAMLTSYGSANERPS